MTDRLTIDAPADEVPGNESGSSREPASRVAAAAPTRVFRLGGEWYFSTRDGDIGPFRTREQAKREAFAHDNVLHPAG